MCAPVVGIQAEVLLKRLLTHAAETHHSVESENSSSCSLPSLLNDSGEIKLARPSKKSFSSTGACGQCTPTATHTFASHTLPFSPPEGYVVMLRSLLNSDF